MTDLVAALGSTNHRKTLLQGLLDYRALLATLGYQTGLQFIDGTFVENVEQREQRDPGDIDVFSFLVRPQRYQQDAQLWQQTGFPEWNAEIVDFDRNKLRFGLDTYAVAVDEQGPLRLINATVYWYSLFAHKRVTHDWKGFLWVPIDAQDDATARAALS
jgi:Family of unknown function (DUF6932)